MTNVTNINKLDALQSGDTLRFLAEELKTMKEEKEALELRIKEHTQIIMELMGDEAKIDLGFCKLTRFEKEYKTVAIDSATIELESAVQKNRISFFTMIEALKPSFASLEKLLGETAAKNCVESITKKHELRVTK